jgi:RNA polymerase sigma factor (sigma-70 family)
MPTQQLDELAIILRAKDGDEEAVLHLIEKNKGAINVAVRCMRPANSHVADDLRQAAVVGILEAIRRYDPAKAQASKSSFFTYAVYWIRISVQREAERSFDRPGRVEANLDARPARPEADGSCFDLLSRLPADERQVVRLFYGLDGAARQRPIARVAAMLGLSVDEAKDLHREALARLRRTILINPAEAA